MTTSARILLTISVVASAAVVGVIVSSGRQRRQGATPIAAAPSPLVLQRLGTPKDLCCCRILDDGQTNLSEALENYAKARSQGEHKEACLQASCVVDEYNRAVNLPHPSHADLAHLVHWRQIEQAECAAGGYLPRQR